MGKIIEGEIFIVQDGGLERITGYLSSQGMTFQHGVNNNRMFIEVKEYPEILTRLESAGVFDCSKKKDWPILSITESGVTLYFAHHTGDGYIFIPNNNIIAIHTLEDDHLKKIRGQE